MPQKDEEIEASEVQDNSNILSGFITTTKDIFKNPTGRYVVAAGSMRFFGGYAIGFYKP